MFVDTEIGATTPRRQHMPYVEYLLVAALVAVTIVLFFVMGFFSEASAEAGGDMGQHLAGYARTSNMDASALHTASLITPAGHGFELPQAATRADRYILIGLTLLSIAVMAASTFGLWRWQIRGLMQEAHHRGR